MQHRSYSPTQIERRNFLRLALGAAAAAGVGSPLLLASRRAFASSDLARLSPIATVGPLTGAKLGSVDFNGDELDRPHDLLWNKEQYLREHGGIPAPDETAGVVVIGGGVAGLTAAYRLRGAVVFEAASRLGGNAKGERWGDSEYSIGAAYFSKPDPDSETLALLKSLGLDRKLREETGDETMVQLGDRLVMPFWSGATDPARAPEFERAWKVFEKVRDHGFPDIPFRSDSSLSRTDLLALDALSFEQWVHRELGPELHPHIQEMLMEYCWSSFATEWHELSAAQALSFLSSDLGGTVALPGGNSLLTQTLVEKIVERDGAAGLRTGAMVLDVTADAGGVTVAYEDASRKFRAIRARACVFAAPKMIARFTVNGLPATQAEAMARLKYRAYLVANVLLDRRVPSPSYELYRLEGQVPTYPMGHLKESPKRAWSDLCFGSWAAGDKPSRSVLTLYKALAWDGARQFLFSPFSHDRHREPILRDLPQLLKALAVPESAVAGVRLTRWGHAIPVAKVGMLASGDLEKVRAPVGGRIFFCGQDCWANPCAETAIITAEEAAAAARALG